MSRDNRVDLSTLETRQAEISRLRADNADALTTPLMSEGGISATQVNRMSARERAIWQERAQRRMCVESRIRELSKSDDELRRAALARRRRENESRAQYLRNRIDDLTRIGMGKRGKVRPTYQVEIDKARAELAKIEGE